MELRGIGRSLVKRHRNETKVDVDTSVSVSGHVCGCVGVLGRVRVF